MRECRSGRITAGILWLVSLILSVAALPAAVQAQTMTTSGSVPMLKLYVDGKGQVFTTPARGRRLLTEIPATALAPQEIEKRVEEKTQQQIQAAQQQIQKSNDELKAQNQQLTQQVADMKPAWQDYVDTWKDKFHIGGLLYGDYALYTHTGFGPQFLTQIEWPGPGNNTYNSFDITRTYLNFLFTPTDDWVMRITPNVYRTIGAPSANAKFGSTAALGSNLNGNLGVRMKYAYAQYKKLFSNIDSMKEDTVTVGQVANPLVGWEEDLYNFRFVNLTPWNYLSLSSTQAGASIQGPIKFNEKQYVDYDIGVFNNASFHALEATNTKEAMARVSIYPFGALWRFQGLGITGFYNYGYGNTTPDTASMPAEFKGPDAHIVRLAAILHYTAENWGIAAEYDYGKNAFSSGNLYSGSGPGDAFGFPTSYSTWTKMVHSILDTGNATEQGFDFFGHLHIPTTPFTLFGMWESFYPNTHISKNPLDFQRWVVGVGYQYNEFVRFAVDSQNLMYPHSQFTYPADPAYGLDTSVSNPVPRDTHVFMANIEFNF
jgi:hypothetical protein